MPSNIRLRTQSFVKHAYDLVFFIYLLIFAEEGTFKNILGYLGLILESKDWQLHFPSFFVLKVQLRFWTLTDLYFDLHVPLSSF